MIELNSASQPRSKGSNIYITANIIPHYLCILLLQFQAVMLVNIMKYVLEYKTG